MIILSWILVFASVLLGCYGIVVILLFVSAIMIQKRDAEIEEGGADGDD